MSDPVTMTAYVPEGVGPGMPFNVQVPDGQIFQLSCPEGGIMGTPVQFAYIPLPAEPAELTLHDDDVQRLADAAQRAAAQQEALLAQGVQTAEVSSAAFEGNQFAPASYYIGQNLIVTRSSGDESACQVVEIFLTALGPKYNVYLGTYPDSGEPVFKWVDDSDLRLYG
mmetsp:Transcript_55342/g.87766  ORF Transcript_55342/g.87766 Transcript_55342/m.87766 type:complete len:168 (-) Transcript_55342:184-687(-)